MSNDFPYAEKLPVNRGLPEHGRPREEVLARLRGPRQGGLHEVKAG